jgi:two-component system response regulator HydG
MPNVDGLEFLKYIKDANRDNIVIMITGHGTVNAAVSAMKMGAFDFITKPIKDDLVKLSVSRAMNFARLRDENVSLKEHLKERQDFDKIIGYSDCMKKVFDTIDKVSNSDSTVLITGESGTGKELVARAIHFKSDRRSQPMIPVNCGAIPEELLESELFGHEKGAFTGADRRREGKFVQAEGGSLFLDEVSEMSPAMQVKLLRVLQERELTRVGGAEVIKVNVRLIAASNKDLKKEMEKGHFREDLFYRLNVVALNVPPLRKRKEDIPMLAQHFLQQFVAQNSKKIKGFTPQAMEKLLKYSWPGNIRELMNAIERAVVLSRKEYLDAEELVLMMADNSVDVKTTQNRLLENLSLEEVEKMTILEALANSDGNKSEASRRLGITRKTLRKKLEKYKNIV